MTEPFHGLPAQAHPYSMSLAQHQSLYYTVQHLYIASLFSPQELGWVSSTTLIRLAQVMQSDPFIFPKQKIEVL